jgi:hypothetical protein
MNYLMNYLFGRMGKRTCPIIKIEKVFDISYNSPWNEYYVIEIKDGTTVELMEKPKFEYSNKNPKPRL